MLGKWWLLPAGGAGEPGEAAEGNGAAGKVHLSRTRQKKWAKIDPLSSFSSCPRISQSGEGGRAARWAAPWPDPGRPSARPGRPFGPPFGPPLFLKGGPRRPGRPGGHQGGPQAFRAARRTRDVKPVAVGSAAMAASKAVQLHSSALELGGAGLPSRRSTSLA